MNIQKQLAMVIGITLFLFLGGCGSVPHSTTTTVTTDCASHAKNTYADPTGYPTTISTTQKLYSFGTCLGETTPVVWNGNILLVISNGQGFKLYDLASNALINTVNVPGGDFSMISAMVNNGTLYVFGTDGLDYQTYTTHPGNQVRMVQSSDLMTWTSPIVVFQADSQSAVYNTSVTPDPQGFVMTMDVLEPDLPNIQSPRYVQHFARSVDLTSFTSVPGELGDYAACPSIRYVNGYYYEIFVQRPGPYFMAFIARSQDLKTWDKQNISEAVFSPLPPVDYEHNVYGNPAINNSDVDLVEYNGNTYFTYLYGDQATWGGLGIAKSNMTMQEYFAQFF